MMSSVGCASLLALLVACAPILRSDVIDDRPLAPEVARSAIEGSRVYRAEARAVGDLVVVRLERAGRCAVVTTPRVRRTRHVVRRTEGAYMKSAWTIAALGVLTGTFAYLDAEGLAERANADDPTQMATPEGYRAMGLVLFGVGAVATVAALGSELRARDSVEDGGVVTGAPVREERACGVQPVAAARVTLVAGDDRVDGVTDGEGRVELPLTAAWSEAGVVALAHAALLVAGERVEVALGEQDRAAIAEALEANPASRLAREREEARVKEAAARCARGIEELGGRLDGTIDRIEATIVETALAATAAACGEDARVEGLRARFAAALEALEVREREDAREAALEEALVELEQAMDDGDAEAAYRALVATPALRSMASEQTKDLARGLLGWRLEEMLAAGAGSEAARAMCFSRKVFERVVGAAELRSRVQRFVRQVGTSDPAFAARAVRALKAGTCR